MIDSTLQIVKACFYEEKTWTKNTLHTHLGLSLSGITSALKTLQENREILYCGDEESTGGRKSKQYQLNPDYHHILKIILEHKEEQDVLYAIDVNLLNEELFRKIAPVRPMTPSSLKQNLLSMLEEDERIHMIVISIPGICTQGKIRVCDIEGLINTSLQEELKDLHKALIIENDVNTGAIGLSHHYSQYDNIALVYQPSSKYSGSGLIINRRLYNGFSHASGELRYLPAYSLHQQDQLLKEDPQCLLKNQVQSLISILNPDLIAICSDVVTDIPDLMFDDIPKSDLPEIIEIKTIYNVIEYGLYQMSMSAFKGDTNEYKLY